MKEEKRVSSDSSSLVGREAAWSEHFLAVPGTCSSKTDNHLHGKQTFMRQTMNSLSKSFRLRPVSTHTK